MKRLLFILVLGGLALQVASACAQGSRPQERRQERREERREDRREERRRHRRQRPAAVQPLSGPWTGILDPSRAIDWSHAGATIDPGGSRTQCVPTGAGTGDIQANGTVMPHGGTDITDANNINAALQTCPVNTYLLLGQGTFYIVNGLTFGSPVDTIYKTPMSNVTLRGSGPDKTILKVTTTGARDCGGIGNAICILGSNEADTQQFYPYAGSCAWTAGYSQGSTQLTLGTCYNSAMPVVGQIILLDQRNDDIGIYQCTSSGTTATCTVSTPTLPANFVVGACVGLGGVGNVGAMPTSASPNYNAQMMTPQRNPTTCNAITAVSGNTFSYNLAYGSNLATVGPCVATTPSVTPKNTTCGFATIDTNSTYVTGVYCVTADANCPSLSGGLQNGRICPDPTNRNPVCASGEISWRSLTQIVKITNVSGNVITIDTPLYANNWRATQNPGVWWISAAGTMQNDGIESMTIDCSNDGGTSVNNSIAIQHCYNCWMRNIRSIAGSQSHVQLTQIVSHFTIRDSYFFDTKRGASQSYGVLMIGSTSDVLLENNIFIRNVAALLNGGSYGAVESYNYMRDDGYGTVGLMMPMLVGNHDVNEYNLFESNNSPTSAYDNIHGTSGPATHFRERTRGQSVPAKNNYLNAFQISNFNRSISIIGSVLGSAAYQVAGSNRYSLDGIGLPNCTPSILCTGSTSQSGNSIPDDPLVLRGLMRWGNYDTMTAAVRWCGVGTETNCSGTEIPGALPPFLSANPVPSSHTLPPSFYLTAKPVFYTTKWGAPPWPSIGPDVTGGTATPPDSTGDANGGGMVYQIPSGIVAANMPFDSAYQITGMQITLATWASGSPALATLTGTFTMPLYGSFQLTGMTPAGYNGTYQIYSQNGPTSDSSSGTMTAAAGGSVPYGPTYRISSTRLNGCSGTPTVCTGETTKTGTISFSNLSSTCTGSSPTGNCSINVPSPCAANSANTSCSTNGTYNDPQAATYYNVYINDKADPNGKMCRQNAAPIPITPGCTSYGIAACQNYQQTTPICQFGNSASCSNTGGQCIEPPTITTAVSTQIRFLLPNNPGGNGTGGTITSPMVQVFNADSYYGVAPPVTTPSGITGHGTITGQGKIT